MSISTRYGTDYGKNQFDDSEYIAEMDSVKIHEIHLYDNGNYFAGLQVFYRACNQIVTPGPHCTVDIDDIEDPKKWRDFKGKYLRKSSIKLEEDEYVIKVEVRSGDIIDGLKIITNKGNSVTSGGQGGSGYVYSQNNQKLVAFSGSHPNSYDTENYWCTMHHLNLHFAPLDEEEKLLPKK